MHCKSDESDEQIKNAIKCGTEQNFQNFQKRLYDLQSRICHDQIKTANYGASRDMKVKSAQP